MRTAHSMKRKASLCYFSRVLQGLSCYGWREKIIFQDIFSAHLHILPMIKLHPPPTTHTPQPPPHEFLLLQVTVKRAMAVAQNFVATSDQFTMFHKYSVKNPPVTPCCLFMVKEKDMKNWTCSCSCLLINSRPSFPGWERVLYVEQ